MSLKQKEKAEQLFRKAFERLKSGKTKVLDSGSPVTQNNVAREAGRDPSALKKDRYPILVAEIQLYISNRDDQSKQTKKRNDNRSRSIEKKLEDCQKQRDHLSSIVAAQNNYIDDLLDKIEILKSGKMIRK